MDLQSAPARGHRAHVTAEASGALSAPGLDSLSPRHHCGRWRRQEGEQDPLPCPASQLCFSSSFVLTPVCLNHYCSNTKYQPE